VVGELMPLTESSFVLCLWRRKQFIIFGLCAQGLEQTFCLAAQAPLQGSRRNIFMYNI